jgi:hypothetical protein
MDATQLGLISHFLTHFHTQKHLVVAHILVNHPASEFSMDKIPQSAKVPIRKTLQHAGMRQIALQSKAQIGPLHAKLVPAKEKVTAGW